MPPRKKRKRKKVAVELNTSAVSLVGRVTGDTLLQYDNAMCCCMGYSMYTSSYNSHNRLLCLLHAEADWPLGNQEICLCVPTVVCGPTFFRPSHHIQRSCNERPLKLFPSVSVVVQTTTDCTDTQHMTVNC